MALPICCKVGGSATPSAESEARHWARGCAQQEALSALFDFRLGERFQVGKNVGL